MSEGALRKVLRAMLNELEAHQLTVCLAPAPRPRHECHYIRVKTDENPRWYRNLCGEFPVDKNKRKLSTKIKRRSVLSVLSNYLATGFSASYYFPVIKREAEKYKIREINYRKKTRQIRDDPF